MLENWPATSSAPHIPNHCREALATDRSYAIITFANIEVREVDRIWFVIDRMDIEPRRRRGYPSSHGLRRSEMHKLISNAFGDRDLLKQTRQKRNVARQNQIMERPGADE